MACFGARFAALLVLVLNTPTVAANVDSESLNGPNLSGAWTISSQTQGHEMCLWKHTEGGEKFTGVCKLRHGEPQEIKDGIIENESMVKWTEREGDYARKYEAKLIPSGEGLQLTEGIMTDYDVEYGTEMKVEFTGEMILFEKDKQELMKTLSKEHSALEEQVQNTLKVYETIGLDPKDVTSTIESLSELKETMNAMVQQMDKEEFMSSWKETIGTMVQMGKDNSKNIEEAKNHLSELYRTLNDAATDAGGLERRLQSSDAMTRLEELDA